MSSPHFNSITAIGCLLCYIHVFLAVLGNSFVYGKGSRSVCVVSSSGNQSDTPYRICYALRTYVLDVCELR